MESLEAKNGNSTGSEALPPLFHEYLRKVQGSEARTKVVRILLEGGTTVEILCARTGIKKSSIGGYLSEMQNWRLISSRRESKTTSTKTYSLTNPEATRAALNPTVDAPRQITEHVQSSVKFVIAPAEFGNIDSLGKRDMAKYLVKGDRLAVARLLIQSPRSTREICLETALTFAEVSHVLTQLRSKGLVVKNSTTDGVSGKIIYRMKDPAYMGSILAMIQTPGESTPHLQNESQEAPETELPTVTEAAQSTVEEVIADTAGNTVADIPSPQPTPQKTDAPVEVHPHNGNGRVQHSTITKTSSLPHRAVHGGNGNGSVDTLTSSTRSRFPPPPSQTFIHDPTLLSHVLAEIKTQLHQEEHDRLDGFWRAEGKIAASEQLSHWKDVASTAAYVHDKFIENRIQAERRALMMRTLYLAPTARQEAIYESVRVA